MWRVYYTHCGLRYEDRRAELFTDSDWTADT